MTRTTADLIEALKKQDLNSKFGASARQAAARLKYVGGGITVKRFLKLFTFKNMPVKGG